MRLFLFSSAYFSYTDELKVKVIIGMKYKG